MILAAARKHDIDLAASIMVGDRWRDVEAGQGAGCRPVLIDYGYSDEKPVQPDHTAPSLLAAVDWMSMSFAV